MPHIPQSLLSSASCTKHLGPYFISSKPWLWFQPWLQTSKVPSRVTLFETGASSQAYVWGSDTSRSTKLFVLFCFKAPGALSSKKASRELSLGFGHKSHRYKNHHQDTHYSGSRGPFGSRRLSHGLILYILIIARARSFAISNQSPLSSMSPVREPSSEKHSSHPYRASLISANLAEIVALSSVS